MTLNKEKPKKIKALANLMALIIGFVLVGWAIGYDSTLFKILVGIWGFLIILSIFLPKP